MVPDTTRSGQAARITRGSLTAPIGTPTSENPFSFDGPGRSGRRSLLRPSQIVRHEFPRPGATDRDDALRDKESGWSCGWSKRSASLPYHITRDILGVPDVPHRNELRDWTWKISS